MKLKTETHDIWLVFLILFGSVTLSFYAQWLVTASSLGIIALIGYGLLLFLLVFLYCLGTTAFFFRRSEGSIVSPVAVWLFVYLITLFVFLNQWFSLMQDVSSILAFMLLVSVFGLSGVLFIGLLQQVIIQKIFGFVGDEDACYYKSYTSADNYEKIRNILTEGDWLYYINRLKLRKQIESTKLKLEAYDVRRGCHLFFFADEIDKKSTSLSLVAYVRNATAFSSFIDCPDWCKELTDNIISIMKNKGLILKEDNGLELKKEIFEFVFKDIKPLFSQEIVDKISLPLFLLPIIVLVGLSTHYVLKVDAAWTLGIVSIVLTFFAILFEQHRQR